MQSLENKTKKVPNIDIRKTETYQSLEAVSGNWKARMKVSVQQQLQYTNTVCIEMQSF